MRKLVLVTVIAVVGMVASPAPSHAGVGLGMFLGEPLGLTLKVDLERRTSLELLFGVDDYNEGRGRDGYGHLTFLAAPWVGRGDSVMVPIRFGIGVAVYDDDGGDDWGESIDVAARAPLQVAFQFVGTPLEIYLEIALRLELIDDVHAQPDGGLGIRFYF